MSRPKICKSCNEPKYIHRFGMCKDCYAKWLYNTEEGLEYLNKNTLKAKKEVKKEKNKKWKEKKFKHKTNKERFYGSTAWRYCSKYVLLLYADSSYEVDCCTCGTPLYIANKNCVCGHYLKATDHNSIAFEIKGMLPQCDSCNNHGGRPEIMAEKLKEVHGDDVIDYLVLKSHEELKLDMYEYDQMRIKFRKLFNELAKEKGNPWKT